LFNNKTRLITVMLDEGVNTEQLRKRWPDNKEGPVYVQLLLTNFIHVWHWMAFFVLMCC